MDWRARIPFWTHVITETGARSVYEFGCNAGWNLSAIQRVDPLVQVYGSDINAIARQQAKTALPGDGGDISEVEADLDLEFAQFDLVFTAGVLIHIPPAELEDRMLWLERLSCDYVLAVEYDADWETEVEYRGHAERLWKRPYGRLYEALGLKLVSAGPAPGFDRCTAWLLRK